MTLHIHRTHIARAAQDIEDAARGLDRWTGLDLPTGVPMPRARDDLAQLLGAVARLRQGGLELADGIHDFLADTTAVDAGAGTAFLARDDGKGRTGGCER